MHRNVNQDKEFLIADFANRRAETLRRMGSDVEHIDMLGYHNWARIVGDVKNKIVAAYEDAIDELSDEGETEHG